MTIKAIYFKQVPKYPKLRKQKLDNFSVHLKQFWHFQRINTVCYYSQMHRTDKYSRHSSII